MARADAKDGHDLSEIGQAIVAAWFKVLPDSGNPSSSVIEAALQNLAPELKVVLEKIVDATVVIQVDKDSTNEVNIVVPFPPAKTRPGLIDYLKKFHTNPNSKGRHFHDELGATTLFGCGK